MIDDGYKAQLNTCHTDMSMEIMKLRRPIGLRTLSAERDRFLNFKKMLLVVHGTISSWH